MGLAGVAAKAAGSVVGASAKVGFTAAKMGAKAIGKTLPRPGRLVKDAAYDASIMAHRGALGAYSAMGMLGMAKDHWAATTAIALSVAAVGGYMSQTGQGRPVGPATQGRNPGSSVSNYDLGASGNLVFDLHKLR